MKDEEVLKNIKELTNVEAKLILKFVFPNQEGVRFKEIVFQPIIEKDGSQKVTMSMHPIVGIKYTNEYGDGCVLHFNNTKVVLWLYKNGYEIMDFLEYNSDLSDMEDDFDNLSFVLYTIVNERKDGETQVIGDEDYIKEVKLRLKKALNTYYYKDE